MADRTPQQPVQTPRARTRMMEVAEPANSQSLMVRRTKVAELRRQGLKPPQVAAQVDVSIGTVYRDFIWLDEQYRQLAVADTAMEKGRDLDRIEQAIAALWPRVKEGHVEAIGKALVPLLQHKADLLGTKAPVQIDVSSEVRTLAIAIGLDPDEALSLVEHLPGLTA